MKKLTKLEELWYRLFWTVILGGAFILVAEWTGLTDLFISLFE